MLNFGAGAGWEAVVASATGYREGRDLVRLQGLWLLYSFVRFRVTRRAFGEKTAIVPKV